MPGALSPAIMVTVTNHALVRYYTLGKANNRNYNSHLFGTFLLGLGLAIDSIDGHTEPGSTRKVLDINVEFNDLIPIPNGTAGSLLL